MAKKEVKQAPAKAKKAPAADPCCDDNGPGGQDAAKTTASINAGTHYGH